MENFFNKRCMMEKKDKLVSLSLLCLFGLDVGELFGTQGSSSASQSAELNHKNGLTGQNAGSSLENKIAFLEKENAALKNQLEGRKGRPGPASSQGIAPSGAPGSAPTIVNSVNGIQPNGPGGRPRGQGRPGRPGSNWERPGPWNGSQSGGPGNRVNQGKGLSLVYSPNLPSNTDSAGGNEWRRGEGNSLRKPDARGSDSRSSPRRKGNFAGPGTRGKEAGAPKSQGNSLKNAGPNKPNQKFPAGSNTGK
jgi:hypothetical protein